LRFNPRAPYGARPGCVTGCGSVGSVSIHAPRTGRDNQIEYINLASGCFNPRAPYGARLHTHNKPRDLSSFNPRAPYGARRERRKFRCSEMARFQSTRPVRGATGVSIVVSGAGWFQSTRPVRGATLRFRLPFFHPISFNPRAPYGARREIVVNRCPRQEVSIHAPRTGRDTLSAAGAFR